MLKECTLSNGTVVRVRPVPPLLAAEAPLRDPELRDPPIPLVEVKGVAGTEIVPARRGEKEYEEWMQKRAEVEEARGRVQESFIWNYGVVDWKLPNKETFCDVPPDGWKFPDILGRFGFEVKTRDPLERRLYYIKTELLCTNDDVDAVQVTIMGSSAPLSDEEVKTTLSTFQDSDGGISNT